MQRLSPVELERDLPGYTILGTLGKGASGEVFEGRQAGEGFSRRVAIKVVSDTAAESLPLHETRILAQLEHPGIARLLDAGLTASRLRYLVMELVEGIPCTEFATRQRLSERDRLQLFLQICDAVHYANRSLVIHCDLKPANILVKGDGGVKLLDFGIARLLSEAQSGEGRRHLYTPNYASPEQILGAPLTVATDVFSLGALLCELISGAPPRELSGVSWEELPGRAREVRVPPLAGDLAHIARKALQADPAERYASVGELAADVRCYLQGRPVAARPPAALYRLRRFVVRHWALTAAASTLMLAIFAFTAYALRQRGAAVARFREIRELANFTMFDLHDEIAKLPASLKARHTLVARAVRYLDTLGRSAPKDDEVQLETAKGWLRLGDIEGVSNEPSLGQSGSAVNRVEQAERIVRTVAARSPNSLAAQRALYQALEAQAALDRLRGGDKGVALAQELLSVAERNVSAAPNNAEVREELAAAQAVLANQYTQSPKHFGRGVAQWLTAVAAWKKLADEKPDSVLRKRELARSYQFLAGAQLRAQAREEARENALVAYRMHKELQRVPGEDVEHMIAADVGLVAVVSAQLKRYAEAIPMFEEQLRLREGLVAKDPDNFNARLGVGGTLQRIGSAYVLLGQVDKGMPYLMRSLDTQREVYNKDPANVLSGREMLYVLADLAEASGILKRREPMCRYAAEGAAVMRGSISKARETATDAAKKKSLRKSLALCGLKE